MGTMPRWKLLRHRDFRLLLVGESLSQAGAMVGHTVLPLIAVHTLAVGAFEMGVLAAAETLAFLLVGLPAGVWIDRWRRKAVMVSTALVRAVVLLSIPLAWWLGLLTFAQMSLVAFTAGACSLFFDVAYQSVAPLVLDRESLVRGNAALQSSQSVAQLAGPPVGGALTQVLGPVVAALPIAASHLGTALAVGRMEVREPARALADDSARLGRAVWQGLEFLWRDRVLRAIALSTITCNLFSGVQQAVLMLFLARTNGLTPTAIGVMFACGGLGGIVAAATSASWVRRFGLTQMLWLSMVTTLPLGLLIPLAEDGPMLPVAVIGYTAMGFGAVLFNVTQVTHRQLVAPERLLGRLNATMRFLTWGVIPIGALLGGVLGDGAGIQQAMWTASIGIACGPIFLVLSPAGPRRSRNDG
ncbi:MFS transporter [Actinokineospora sp. HUAS TT18]|uniref:MFS transporter n=1 Tax=Actinokineospora sp. HUAS TT18 TaxID=3447451 RepID=UPI003F520660